MKKKKYATGTGVTGIAHDYMPSPAEVLAEDSINKVKAQSEASSNPWAMAVQIAGMMGANYASSGQMGDKDAQSTGFGQFATKNFANGGIVGSNGIEAEGGEIAEAPGQMPVELQGPSHEAGGIDLAVPTGTKIYSKRLKVDGKTMAERKEGRNRVSKRYDKLLDIDSTDKAIRNSSERTGQALAMEEENDLLIQQMANMIGAAKDTYATGTGPNGVGFEDFLAMFDPNFRPVTEKDPTGVPNIGTAPNTPATFGTQNYAIDQDNLMTESFLPEQSTLPGESTPVQMTNEGGTYKPGIGDYTAIAGDLISTFGPMKNTLAARAGDTPNINPFLGFGEDGLAANEEAKEYVASQRDNTLRRIRSNANTSKRAARGSARGVNTQRALDLAIDSGVNDSQISAEDVFSRQMMALLSEQSSLENQQDSVVMQGEGQRDQADRMDRDNFYTQKGKDISTMGTGVQTIGKDINAITQNANYMKILNQMSKYFRYDSKGNIIGINQTTE